LRSSSTVYSALGIVKLSRTNFGFFTLAGFSAFGLANDLTAGLAAALVIDAERLATGFAVTLEATTFSVVTGAAGIVVTLGATGATVLTELAIAIFFSVVAMVGFP
jgi:hypothetical protein